MSNCRKTQLWLVYVPSVDRQLPREPVHLGMTAIGALMIMSAPRSAPGERKPLPVTERPGEKRVGGEPAWRGQPRSARSYDGTGADVALRSAGAWMDLRAVGAGYVGAETGGSRIPFPPPAKGRPDSQTLPFARDTYFFRYCSYVARLLESILLKLPKKLYLPNEYLTFL
jgi:hypothetical protein